jgi:hypothetical protein
LARIRTIKPEFFLHEDLAELSPLHRLLFVGLWTLCDSKGRTADRPKRIKLQVLPYDNCDVDQMLADLSAATFVVRYEAGGNRYLWVPSFLDHQRLTPKEAACRSEIPSAPGDTSSEGSTRDDPGASPGSQEGKGKEGKGTEGSAARAATQPGPLALALIAYLRETYPAEQWTPELASRWLDAYPGVNLLAEAKKAVSWEASNKSNRKKDHAAFLARWYARQQDRGGGAARSPYRELQPPSDQPGGSSRVPGVDETRRKIEERDALPRASAQAVRDAVAKVRGSMKPIGDA